MATASSLPSASAIRYPVFTRRQLMLRDLFEGCMAWRVWLLLAWQDIRLRYRRSQLGPFWLTLSMAITVYTMGFLYGHLFHMDLHTYFPYLAAGMLTWNLISLLIVDGTNTFTEAEQFLRQMKLPYSVFVLRVIMRSLIIFAHNVLVIVPLYFVLHIQLSSACLMIIPGLILLSLNAFFFGIVLAIIGARYRDLGQLITSLLQVCFFLTPVMWSPTILPVKYHLLLDFNPFTHFVEILRAPLISTMPSLLSVEVVIGMTCVGILLAAALLTRVRHRIVYWL